MPRKPDLADRIGRRDGGCSCRKVRYGVSGAPLRVGICHCKDCRRESGSMFTTFGIWPREAFQSAGRIQTWEGRSFCPECGSSLFALRDDEAEIKLGTLDDAPTELAPQYELWIGRREHWLRPLEGARQFAHDREP